MNDETKEQMKLAASQSISEAEEMESYDHTTSSIILTETVTSLMENFFVVRGLSLPTTKDCLSTIKQKSKSPIQALKVFFKSFAKKRWSGSCLPQLKFLMFLEC